jgi:hypothetical protein
MIKGLLVVELFSKDCFVDVVVSPCKLVVDQSDQQSMQ